MTIRGRWAAWLTCTTLAVSSLGAAAQTAPAATRTVRDGVFTEAQAARGSALYKEQCASCHGPALEGVNAPPLKADAFLSRWQGQSLADLESKIRNTMPEGASGSLTPPQSVDLVAHLLKTSGFPARATELTSDATALGRVTFPRAAAPAQVVAGAARIYPPLGNMAQLMRGIFFPNSNLIFTVQTHDPGAPAPAAPPAGQAAGFSWVDWGAGIYGGWQLVDNSALALADASPLMLAPGIRCENGRLAPVNEPDWIKYTEQMIAVARKTYQASQSRSQDAVSEATGDLSDACFNCHQAYRDVRQPGREFDPTNPASKAGRCMPRSSTR